MQRRNILRLAGGGFVAAAVVGTGAAFWAARVPASAVAAWQAPAGETDLRRWVLSCALLAPNPHNQQPWLADIRQAGEITLRLDTQRLLPATDPFGRQILMGVGAFMALLVMAAAERGHRAQVVWFPEGEPGARLDGRPFAHVRLLPDAATPRDPLFAQLLLRRTDRRAYDPARPPTAQQVQALQSAVPAGSVRFGLAGAAPADGPKLAALRQIVREAWRLELSTEATMMESMHVLRVGGREIDAHRDGISIVSPMLVALERVGLFDRSRYPGADAPAIQGQIRDFDAVTASTPAYLWLVTEGNRRSQQIEAGQAYVRVNLAATAQGLALHPNEQSLQEYPEVSGPYRAVHTLLDSPAPAFTVQMLARVGHLPEGSRAAAPAPRRGLARQLVA